MKHRDCKIWAVVLAAMFLISVCPIVMAQTEKTSISLPEIRDSLVPFSRGLLTLHCRSQKRMFRSEKTYRVLELLMDRKRKAYFIYPAMEASKNPDLDVFWYHDIWHQELPDGSQDYLDTKIIRLIDRQATLNSSFMDYHETILDLKAMTLDYIVREPVDNTYKALFSNAFEDNPMLFKLNPFKDYEVEISDWTVPPVIRGKKAELAWGPWTEQDGEFLGTLKCGKRY
jgi:hypothetical protein